MTHADSERDAALLAELAEVLRGDLEPPPEVVRGAKELFTWRTVDAELAELSYDSLVGGVASVRSPGQPRILSFDAGSLTIEVEIDRTPGGRRLLGQLVPPSAAELELRTGGEPVVGRADELGRFVLPLPADERRTSVRCVLPDGRAVQSSWMVI